MKKSEDFKTPATSMTVNDKEKQQILILEKLEPVQLLKYVTLKVRAVVWMIKMHFLKCSYDLLEFV